MSCMLESACIECLGTGSCIHLRKERVLQHVPYQRLQVPTFDGRAYRHRDIVPMPHPLAIAIQDASTLPHESSRRALRCDSTLRFLELEEHIRAMFTIFAPILMPFDWGGSVARLTAFNLLHACKTLVSFLEGGKAQCTYDIWRHYQPTAANRSIFQRVSLLCLSGCQ